MLVCVLGHFYHLFLGMCKLLQGFRSVSDLCWRRSVNVLYERDGRRQNEKRTLFFFFFLAFYFLCVYGTPNWKLPSGGTFVILDHGFVLRENISLDIKTLKLVVLNC